MPAKLNPPPSNTKTFDYLWNRWLYNVFKYFGTPGAAEPLKAIVLDDQGKLDEIDVTTLKLSGAEVTATAAEVNYNDLTTGPGTAEASKAVVLDANKDIAGIRHIDFGGQLKFPATQAVSADANTLDDYEEGTWTPVLSFATPGTSSFTYSNQTGNYIKIGRIAYVQFDIRLSAFSKGTASGFLEVSGLPFSILNTSGYDSTTGTITLYNMPFTGNPKITAYGTAINKLILIKEVTNSAYVSIDDPDNNSILRGSVSYQAEV